MLKRTWVEEIQKQMEEFQPVLHSGDPTTQKQRCTELEVAFDKARGTLESVWRSLVQHEKPQMQRGQGSLIEDE